MVFLRKILVCILCFLFIFSTSITNLSNISVSASSQKYVPDSIITTTDLSGSLSYIQDDVNVPDANWYTAVDGTVGTTLEATFQDPGVTLQTGANLQTVSALVRKNASGGTAPTVKMLVYDNNNGTRTQIGTTVSQVIPDGNTILTMTFDASSLVDKTGKNLEIKLYAITGTGTASNRRTMEVGAVNFIATTVGDTTPPAEISNLQQTHTSTTVNFTYTNPPDSDFSKVNIYRNGSLIGSSTNGSFSDSGLSSSTSYNYKLTTVDTSNNESIGTTITVTTNPPPDTTPPAEISNLQQTHTDTTINFTWTNPPDSDFLKVNIYKNGSLIGSSTNGSFSVNSLSPSTSYNFKLTTVDTTGNESTGTTITVTTNSSGSLSITSPTNVNFGTTTVDGTIKSLTIHLSDLTVSDTRSVNNGWNVTVSASPLTETSPSGTALTLPVNTLSLQGISSITQTSGSSSLPTALSGSPWFIDNGPVKILSAASGAGVGSFDVNFGSSSLKLTIDTSKKVTNPLKSVTAYQSTLTWTISSSP